MSTATVDTQRPGVPLTRLVQVELRKLVDTRSSFWLLASIAIVSTIASLGVLIFVKGDDQAYGMYAQAIGFPVAILLPIVSILLVTSEWSQRSGLITFTLAPHRGAVLTAKFIASLLAGVAGLAVALIIGAGTALLGSLIKGGEMIWDLNPNPDQSFLAGLAFLTLAFVLGQLIGFMFGTLIRNSAGAIVGYFVYGFVVPAIFGTLDAFTSWFDDIYPWVDFGMAQGGLFEGEMSGEQWAHLGVSGLIWFVIPMSIGVWAILRSEVK